MKVLFTESAEADLLYWLEHNKHRTVAKIKALIENIKVSPFTGIGKPEPLRLNLQGCWSRHITREHRLVYRIENNNIIIISCRFHYYK